MKRINKILSFKSSFLLITVYILFFLFLNAEKELLHNHKPDIYEHDDCPVLILNYILSTGVAINIELKSEFIVESTLEIQQIDFIYQPNLHPNYFRGPPLI